MKNNLIEALVRQAQSGNRDAFNHLAERFRRMAFYEALRWLGDQQSAEDATQDALLAAYTNLHQLRSPRKFGAWFRQIVRSQCNLVTRRKHPRLEPLDKNPDLSANTLTPEKIIERREHRSMVQEAINQLPENERIVTEEFYLNGEKQADIAEKLDIPVTTVKKRLQYARKKLKGLIDLITLDDPEKISLGQWNHLIRRLWRQLQRKFEHYERYTAQFCHLLFFAGYTNFIAYRQPDDRTRHRHLDL